MQQETRKFGQLETLIVSPSGFDNQNPTVIFLHGYGANFRDLAPLTQYLAPTESVNFIFPNAPLKLGQAANGGRAWFLIDDQALEQAIATSTFRDLSVNLPAGLQKSHNKILEMINDLQLNGPVILAGFSQGAMLASNIVLSENLEFKALVILSGALLDKNSWQEKAKKKSGQNYFQSHGTKDVLLSYDYAKELNQILEDNNWQGAFFGFDGGHEIPFPIIEKLADFIKQTFSQ